MKNQIHRLAIILGNLPESLDLMVGMLFLGGAVAAIWMLSI